MKTYDLTDKEGRVFAFEVDNLFLRRGRVARILQQIPGCKILHKASLMDSLNCEGDEFLEF
jgi:hypothetical protein